jgi:hypothetical protein
VCGVGHDTEVLYLLREWLVAPILLVKFDCFGFGLKLPDAVLLFNKLI